MSNPGVLGRGCCRDSGRMRKRTGEQNDRIEPGDYQKSGDPEMLRANQEARKTFRFFWKEISWDFNRIIPP